MFQNGCNTLALFVHICGILLLFAAIGISSMALGRWRKSETLAELRLWAGTAKGVEKLHKISTAAFVLSGLYLAFVGNLWSKGWLLVSIVATVIQVAMGPLLLGPSVGAVMKEAGGPPEAPVSPKVRTLIAQSRLWTIHSLMHGVGLGILFLMVAKPVDMVTSVAIWLGFGALGAAGSLFKRQAAPAAPVEQKAAEPVA